MFIWGEIRVPLIKETVKSQGPAFCCRGFLPGLWFSFLFPYHKICTNYTFTDFANSRGLKRCTCRTSRSLRSLRSRSEWFDQGDTCVITITRNWQGFSRFTLWHWRQVTMLTSLPANTLSISGALAHAPYSGREQTEIMSLGGCHAQNTPLWNKVL